MGAKEQQRIGSLGSCSHFATYCVTVSKPCLFGPQFSQLFKEGVGHPELWSPTAFTFSLR